MFPRPRTWLAGFSHRGPYDLNYKARFRQVLSPKASDSSPAALTSRLKQVVEGLLQSMPLRCLEGSTEQAGQRLIGLEGVSTYAFKALKDLCKVLCLFVVSCRV